jgi:hypothetical protein
MKFFEKKGFDYSKALKSGGSFLRKSKKTKNILSEPNEYMKLLKDKGPLYKKGPLYEKSQL